MLNILDPNYYEVYFIRRLLQGNEAGRVRGTNTRATVLDGLVGDGELSKVMADHFGLDFNLVEGLAVVNTKVGSNKLGDNDHVAQVGLDNLGFVFGRSAGSSGFLNTLDQSHRLVLQATEDLATGTSREKLKQTLAINFQ